ncbi:MAG: phospholipid carrier-dependent glycosyltransferase [Caldilineaceae bacterium]|nr:phospholipid carrier-dependent glycosyltransferase [Caldilineaceae bacterium]
MKPTLPTRRPTLLTAGILCLLFLTAWLPRMLSVDAFVTPDERKWLARSANFYLALHEQDPVATMQTEHPGVTVMWIGALGWRTTFPDYVDRTPGSMSDIRLEEWLAQDGAHTPLEILAGARRWMVLAIAGLLTLAFLPLRRLFGAPTAALMTLFLALDPYFVALTRLLHLDGLLTVLAVLAVSSFLAWLYRGRQPFYLLLSALATGLAGLTKMPAIFIVPFAGMLLVIEMVRRRHEDAQIRRGLVGGYLLWGGITLAVFVLFWPVLWVDAPHVVRFIREQLTVHIHGHELPNYFLGRVTDDPGLLFYPVAMLYRSTPWTLAGLLLAFLLAWRGRPPLDSSTKRWTMFGFLFFAVIFIVGMTEGAKKFDRYVLPALAMLTLVAGLGWAGFLQWIKMRVGRHSLAASVLALLILGQVWTLTRHAPYYFTYYNPLPELLLGSRADPEQVVLVGWGEGLDAAAEWINQQPGSSDLHIAAWYNDGPFSYFRHTDTPRTMSWDDPAFWLGDYVVVYINQRQREIPARDVINYFADQEPVYVVTRDGLDLARVYDLRGAEPPPFTHMQRTPAAGLLAAFGLRGYTLDDGSLFAGETVDLSLFWERTGPITDEDQALIQLLDDDGAVVWQEARAPAGVALDDWPLHEIWLDPYTITLPDDAQGGSYDLVLSLLNGEGVATGMLDVGELVVQQPALTYPDARWDENGIVSIEHPAQMQAGRPLALSMTAQGVTDGRVKISLRLENEAGEVIAQQDKDLDAEMRFSLQTKAVSKPGLYRIIAILYNAQTLAPLADDNGHTEVVLSEVTLFDND